MYIDRFERSCCRRRQAFWMLTGLVLLVACLTPAASAQETPHARPQSPQAKVFEPDQLRKAPGKLLTGGKNKIPTGELKVKTYRLEEVKLPEPMEVNLEGSQETFDSATRLIVTLDSFLNGAYTIWINDEALTGVPTKRNELTALILDSASLEDGASITVTRGDGCNDTSSKSKLPEKLLVPKHLRRPRPQNLKLLDEVSIKMQRVASRKSSHAEGTLGVVVEVTGPFHFDMGRNAEFVAQVGSPLSGGQEFSAGAMPSFMKMDHATGKIEVSKLQTVSFSMTAEQFARLQDQAPIKVKFNFCSPGGTLIGYLDKSLLDR